MRCSFLAVGLAALAVVAAPALAQKEQFSRSKPHVNVGTLGDSGGCMALTGAIVSVAQEDGRPFEPALGAVLAHVADAPAGDATGLTRNVTLVEYESELRHYLHVDCPAHRTYVKNMVTGAAQMDGAILVVRAPDGPMPQTREHVLLARQVGVPALVVFLDAVELVADPALLDQVETEIRDLLDREGFDGANTPVIRGSLARAIDGDGPSRDAIRLLLGEMDRFIPTPARDADRPFLVPVEDVLAIGGRDSIATGRIETGILHEGDACEIVGPAGTRSAVIDRLDLAPRPGTEGLPGDRVRVRLVPIDREIGAADVIAAPGSIAAHVEFMALVHVDARRLESGDHLFVVWGTDEVMAHVDLPPGLPGLGPGEVGTIHVLLSQPVALAKGLPLSIREGGRTVGAGQVIEIIN